MSVHKDVYLVLPLITDQIITAVICKKMPKFEGKDGIEAINKLVVDDIVLSVDEIIINTDVTPVTAYMLMLPIDAPTSKFGPSWVKDESITQLIIDIYADADSDADSDDEEEDEESEEYDEEPDEGTAPRTGEPVT